MSIKQIQAFVELSLDGDNTLKKRCEMLREHKKNVEVQIQEMHKHLQKVICKIDHFTKEYERVFGANKAENNIMEAKDGKDNERGGTAR
jgi:DNA-binding transcriptional MerR regulator